MKAARDSDLTALRWISPSTTDGKSPVGPMLYGQTAEAVLQIHQPWRGAHLRANWTANCSGYEYCWTTDVNKHT